MLKKIIPTVFMLFFTISYNLYGQDSTNTKKWFIALPLRFTTLQNSNTMLFGVKFGRAINNKFHASISIYHSFYLNSFKATANLNGYNEQPRLFINCIATEFDYYFLKSKKVGLGIQLLLGWGFMAYELNEYDFSSRHVNYLAIEPTLNLEYKVGRNNFIGFGIGYRPILSNRQIAYSSNISSGEIPITKQFPNGINFIVTFKGFL